MADVPENHRASKTVVLKSKDGKTFDIEKSVAMKMKFVKNMLEDIDIADCAEVPIGEVNGNILAKVLEFCQFHHDHKYDRTNLLAIESWEKSFIDVDLPTLMQLVFAANFLDFQELLDLTLAAVATKIRDCKTSEEIRAMFTFDRK